MKTTIITILFLAIYVTGFFAVRITHSYQSHIDINDNYSVSTLFDQLNKFDMTLYYVFYPALWFDESITGRVYFVDKW